MFAYVDRISPSTYCVYRRVYAISPTWNHKIEIAKYDLFIVKTVDSVELVKNELNLEIKQKESYFETGIF